jgi:hypothetical protein
MAAELAAGVERTQWNWKRLGCRFFLAAKFSGWAGEFLECGSVIRHRGTAKLSRRAAALGPGC